jgi:hypothetical protein
MLLSFAYWFTVVSEEGLAVRMHSNKLAVHCISVKQIFLVQTHFNVDAC